ncbi:MAG: hypothetical protein JST89_21705 [Cyanobacteria bacterium SZAS-4]|nr:hypothetical protein [Cyanobacteria bacterium SZAS-4]
MTKGFLFSLVCLTMTLPLPAPVGAQTTAEDSEKPAAVGKKLPPGMMFAPGHVLPIRKPINTHVGPKHRVGELVLPVPDNSLWFRYYKAGESASFSGNKTLAHKYWMASLAELEKVKPNPDDDLMSVKLSALEQALTYSYPADWSKETQAAAEIAKRRDEQVSVLEKMALVNRRLVPKDTLLCQKSYERYDIAKKSWEKAAAESKTSTSSGTTQ